MDHPRNEVVFLRFDQAERKLLDRLHRASKSPEPLAAWCRRMLLGEPVDS